MGKFFSASSSRSSCSSSADSASPCSASSPLRANVEPPQLERHLAMRAVDASMERHAPRVTNPLHAHRPESRRRHEALHHELRPLPRRPRSQALDRSPIRSIRRRRISLRSARRSRVAHLLHIRTGIRYTGMPAWDKTLPSRICGRSPCSSPTWTNFRPPCRNIGRPASACRPAVKKEPEERQDQREARPPLSAAAVSVSRAQPLHRGSCANRPSRP